MFAGHIGAAMALGKVERRLNVGVLIFAALLLDVLLWMFVLMGWENLHVPADFPTRRQLAFAFPYSHGLLAACGWTTLMMALTFLMMRRPRPQRIRAALIAGLAVFSHWLLDALVHRPELPLLGNSSGKLGLSLWDRLPLALVVESLLAIAGLWLYLSGSTLSSWRNAAAGVLAVLIMIMTVLGMTVAPPPPGPVQAAATSLIAIVIIVALFAWFDGARGRPPAPPN